MINEYASFGDFVDSAVANIADRERLDGGTGPNGRTFARFWHGGRCWRINADSRVAPLIRAAQVSQPFIEAKTKAGTNTLRIDRKLRDSDGVEVYIYEN